MIEMNENDDVLGCGRTILTKQVNVHMKSRTKLCKVKDFATSGCKKNLLEYQPSTGTLGIKEFLIYERLCENNINLINFYNVSFTILYIIKSHVFLFGQML